MNINFKAEFKQVTYKDGKAVIQLSVLSNELDKDFKGSLDEMAGENVVVNMTKQNEQLELNVVDWPKNEED